MADMKKRQCFMCGTMTARPVPIDVQPAVAPGVPLRGARIKQEWACKDCASFLEDDSDV